MCDGTSPLAMTRVIDDNDNTVYSGWEVTLTGDGKTVMWSTTTLPSGQVSTEEEELVPLAQTVGGDDSGSVISVLSDLSSYGDGHSDCAYAGYRLDDDHFSRESKDPDGTVVDIFKTPIGVCFREEKYRRMNRRDFPTPRGAQWMGLRLASQM
jgi:hypothetical protein